MDIPLNTFSGYLKQIDSSRPGPREQAALHSALPHFWSAKNLVDQDDVKQRVRQFLGQGYEAEAYRFVVKSQTIPNRRFSGGADLPRQRYYTLSQDSSGDDGLTLLAEMRAYRSVRRSALCTVLDTAYPENRLGPVAYSLPQDTRQSMLLVFLGGPELHNPFLEELDRDFSDGNRHPPDADQQHCLCTSIVPIPYRVVKTRIPCVLDLRTSAAQQWLFKVMCVERGNSAGRLYLARPEASFIDLIPWLMSMEIGGSGFTEAVGHLLRQRGANAMIYPSARNDARAIQRRIRRSKESNGWCLVDYRNASAPGKRFLLDFSEQTPFPFEGATQLKWPLGNSQTSWATVGVRELYRYRFYKELENTIGVERADPLMSAMLDLEGDMAAFARFAQKVRGYRRFKTQQRTDSPEAIATADELWVSLGPEL